MTELTGSASAVHAFTLPSDFASSPQITTLDLSHPILDFTSLPSGQILVSLDTAFGVLKHNQTGENKKRSDPTEAEVQQVASSTASALVQVTEGASVSLARSPHCTTDISYHPPPATFSRPSKLSPPNPRRPPNSSQTWICTPTCPSFHAGPASKRTKISPAHLNCKKTRQRPRRV